MMLLVDIGNTRLKWATCADGVPGPQQALARAQLPRDELFANVNEVPQRVIVSNVGGEEIGALVRESARERWQIDAEFLTSTASACGVRNAYPVPGNLGVDRWLGVIAAHARNHALTCIAGVGTAMTIDAIDASGQHLGGVIVPGPQLMVTSLLHNTSDIAQRAAQGNSGLSLFADNTLGAVRQGTAHALAALIERAVATLRKERGNDPDLLLTGGAAHLIEPLLDVPHEVIPDLVLQGLARYSLEP